MTARKTSRKKKSTRSTTARARDALDAGLRDLEKRLPKNLRSAVRDLRRNLQAVQKQLDRARADREQRWKKLETQLRRDTVRLLRRLEKAVAPSSGASRSSARKTTARRRPTRKKATRKKATRKAASRR